MLTALLLTLSHSIFAQYTDCLNFTNLYQPSVLCQYGNFNNPTQQSGVSSTYFGVITDTASRDPYVTSLRTIPKGYTGSIRIGRTDSSSSGCSVTYELTPDGTNQMIFLAYAIMLQKTKQTQFDQINFSIAITDDSGTVIDPQCGQAIYYAGVGDGWENIKVNNDTFCLKNWQTIGIDLTPYMGQKIKIKISTLKRTNIGYAYYSLTCGDKTLLQTNCGLNGQVTFTAPVGYDYRWYEQNNPTTTLSTSQTLTVPASDLLYNCECLSKISSACNFTLTHFARPNLPVANFNYTYNCDSSAHSKYVVRFNNLSRISSNGVISGTDMPDSYLWKFHDGTQSTAINPTKTYAPGTYPVTLIAYMNNENCSDTVQSTISIEDLSVVGFYEASICEGEKYYFSNKVYTMPGLFVDTLKTAQGCDSVNILFLHVNKKYLKKVSGTICQGKVFHLNGKDYTLPGVYNDTLHTKYGCDSVVVLTLNVNPTYSHNITAAICQGQAYSLNGKTYTEAGTYADTLKTINGCDSIFNLTLNINPIYTQNISASTCNGTPYTMHGKSYSAAGVYSDTLKTHLGCDSIFILTLSLNPTYSQNVNAVICQGQSFSMNGKSYAAAGTYADTLKTTSGCDSIFILNLSVNPTYSQTLNASICNGQAYLMNGKSYTLAGSYADTLKTSSGCDSIFILNLSVNPTYSHNITADICQGQSYTLNGKTYAVAGTYADTLKTVHGCDSIFILNLRVHNNYSQTLNASICQGQSFSMNGKSYAAAGTYADTLKTTSGCDSIFILNLSVNPTYSQTLNASICSGQAYLMNGKSYTLAGSYADTLKTVHGCDSIFILNLSVNPTYTHNLSADICQGQSYTLNGKSYAVAGTYADTLKTVHGRDSIFILNLRVHPNYIHNASATICPGDTLIFLGKPYTTDGIYSDTLKTVNGCDSIFILNLNTTTKFYEYLHASICNGESYTMLGKPYSVTGTYTDTLKTVHGCDSIFILDLQVNPTYSHHLNASICQGENFLMNGKTYSSSGTYTDTLKTINGCDSVFTLDLIVNPTYTHNVNAEICQGDTYLLNGKLYTSNGIFSDTLKTIHGCDSIFILNLTVNPSYTFSIPAQICSGESYVMNGKPYSVTGTYTDTLKTVHGCDSIFILDLQVNPTYSHHLNASICQGENFLMNGKPYSSSGTYTDTLKTINGCDSVFTLDLIVNPTYLFRSDTTVCFGEIVHWRGNTYSVSGIYSDSLKTKLGCDSLYTLHLTVKQEIDFTLRGSQDKNTQLGSIVIENTPNPYSYTINGVFNGPLSQLIPGDYTIQVYNDVGCFGVPQTLTFTPCPGVAVEMRDYCLLPGNIRLATRITQGNPIFYTLLFDQKAKDAGFIDRVDSVYRTDTIILLLPSRANPDQYKARLSVRSDFCSSDTVDVNIYLPYSASILKQKWNDVIAIYNEGMNGGYHFTNYQWYKDGEPIPGAVGSYLVEKPRLTFGSEYKVLLTNTNMVTVFTCPIKPVISADFLVYPTLLDRSKGIDQVKIISPHQGSIYLWSMSGTLLRTQQMDKGSNFFSLPNIPVGIYLLELRTEGYGNQIHKIVVK